MPESTYEREVKTQGATFRSMLEAYAGPDSPLDRLDPVLKAGRIPAVGFIGMGSSLFASIPASYMLTLGGLTAHPLDASEYLYYRLDRPGGFLPILTSQSGESAEMKKIAEQWAGKIPYVAVTNTEGSTLASNAAVVLPILGGAEKSTTNKTYTNTLAILALAAAKIGGHPVEPLLKGYQRMPDAIDDLVNGWRERTTIFARFAGMGAEHLDLLARGPSLASAWQGMLILRELSHVKTAGFNVGLFRHGLIPGMKRGGCQIVFAPKGVTHDLTLGLVREVIAVGGRVILVTNADVQPDKNLLVWKLPDLPDAYEIHMPVLEILLIELLGILFAERLGMEPGEGIAKITEKE
jgi:glucosamine--fructose-6-phosphate aminotransferase (isomerizing)